MPATTPSQTVGPYFTLGLFASQEDELVEPTSAGAVRVTGRVLDGAGDPVPDAMVELWQADANGRYRGDFEAGDPAPSEAFLDENGNGNADELARLAAIGYTLPIESQIQFEIDRLNDRLIGLESFFNYVIQLERFYGIEFPFLLPSRPQF